jgi:ABC-type phosphate transport system substrate-binding protein
MMKKITLTIVIVLFVALCNSYGQSYKLIVNTSNNTSSLSAKDVSDMFLKKKVKWANGTAVEPVDLNSNSGVREDFSKRIHGKATSAIRSFWQQAAFSGAATAPPEKANDNEVIEFVKRNPGAIGYISSGASVEGVRTIGVN